MVPFTLRGGAYPLLSGAYVISLYGGTQRWRPKMYKYLVPYDTANQGVRKIYWKKIGSNSAGTQSLILSHTTMRCKSYLGPTYSTLLNHRTTYFDNVFSFCRPVDNYCNCLLKKLPSDNTIILQIGHNTYADDWKFDPLTLYVLFNAPTRTIPFRWTWHWEYVNFCPTAYRMNVQVPYQATTIYSRESLILQTFYPELLFRMFSCSHSPLYQLPCSAEWMMQKLGKYSLAIHVIVPNLLTQNQNKLKFCI